MILLTVFISVTVFISGELMCIFVTLTVKNVFNVLNSLAKQRNLFKLRIKCFDLDVKRFLKFCIFHQV